MYKAPIMAWGMENQSYEKSLRGLTLQNEG